MNVNGSLSYMALEMDVMNIKSEVDLSDTDMELTTSQQNEYHMRIHPDEGMYLLFKKCTQETPKFVHCFLCVLVTSQIK